MISKTLQLKKRLINERIYLKTWVVLGFGVPGAIHPIWKRVVKLSSARQIYPSLYTQRFLRKDVPVGLHQLLILVTKYFRYLKWGYSPM